LVAETQAPDLPILSKANGGLFETQQETSQEAMTRIDMLLGIARF
jgi:hypothetical protein